MFDQYNDGYCPQCMLEDRKEAMILNRADYWECPVCRLQAHSASGGMFAILHERGAGKLRDTLATECVCGWVLSRDARLGYPKAEAFGFKSEDELRAFLSTEVHGTAQQGLHGKGKEAIEIEKKKILDEGSKSAGFPVDI